MQRQLSLSGDSNNCQWFARSPVTQIIYYFYHIQSVSVTQTVIAPIGYMIYHITLRQLVEQAIGESFDITFRIVLSYFNIHNYTVLNL